MSRSRQSTVASYICDEYNGCVPSTSSGMYQTNGPCHLNCPSDTVVPVSKKIWRAVDFGLDNDPASTRPAPPRMTAAKAASKTVPSYHDTFCGPHALETPWRGDAHLNISLRPSYQPGPV